MWSELPCELLLHAFQRLRMPDLKSALLVCKAWKRVVVLEILHACLKLSYFDNYGGDWNSTLAFVNGEWYEFPMKILSQVPLNCIRVFRRLQSVISPNGDGYVLFIAVYKEIHKSTWTMVLSSHLWVNSVVKELPQHYDHSNWPLHVVFWMDGKDSSCSSYKVMIFFGDTVKSGDILVFDSKKGEWIKVVAIPGDYFRSPIVKGDICYALNDFGTKLVSYNLRAAGVFQDVVYLYYPELTRFQLTEFQGQLLLVGVAEELRLFMVEITGPLIRLKEIDEGRGQYVCISISEAKAVNDKVYIRYDRCDMTVKDMILEWSPRVTREVGFDCIGEHQVPTYTGSEVYSLAAKEMLSAKTNQLWGGISSQFW